uniref:Transcription factor EB n=1 Tax=Salmo trutta TaxID=8032 RepID=A0A674DF51_SALTR
MHQFLMRDQLQQEEQRERQLQQNAALQYMQQQRMSAPAPSPAINAPQHCQSMQVPVEVLKVQTHLENPTDYHIRQSQRQQVKEYLSTTYATKQTVHAVTGVVQPSPPPTLAPPGASSSAPPPLHSPRLRTEQLITGNSAPNSPMAMLNIGSSHENEMDEVIDDIISMQSSYDDIQQYIDPVQMSNTVSIISYSHSGGHSCSQHANCTLPQNLRHQWHYVVAHWERCSSVMFYRDVRWNKGTILRASVEYIKRMQKDMQRTREVENNFKRMEMANKQLWLRIEELEMQARLHGLPSSSPSGMGSGELMGSYVKQETSPEEKLQQQQQAQHQAHSHHIQPQQGQPRQLPPLPPHLQPQLPLQYPAVGSSQPFDFAQSLNLCDGVPGYPEGLSGLGELGLLGTQGRRGDLGFLMMDEPLSPLGGDPLLSAMSPEASVDSSRRSSFSIEDTDIL